MLGDEHGVATVRRLLAVLVRRSGGELLRQQLARVLADDVDAAQLDGGGVAAAQVELRADGCFASACRVESIVALSAIVFPPIYDGGLTRWRRRSSR